MTKPVKVAKQEQPTLTENEAAIAKSQRLLETKKHIDARALAIDYIFPLLRKLAAETGDLTDSVTEEIEDIHERLDSFVPPDEVVDTFERAKDLILTLGDLLDQTMVHAGFVSVAQKDGQLVMNVSEKMPKELGVAYANVGAVARDVTQAIQEAIDAAESDDEEEEDAALESVGVSGEQEAPDAADDDDDDGDDAGGDGDDTDGDDGDDDTSETSTGGEQVVAQRKDG